MDAATRSASPRRRRTATLGVSYFGNRNPLHYARDLQEMKANGCNAVLHTFSENDQLFYKKNIAELVHITKEEGLATGLDPWGVGRVFSGEATSDFAFKNRRVCQVYRSGDSAPAACINHPEFVAFMEAWIADAVEMQPDFVFWDEPRFHIVWGDTVNPLTQVCWCEHCRGRFAATHGGDYPAENDEALQAFKKESLLDFISHLCRATRRGNVGNTLCLLPCETKLSGAGDWDRYAAIPELDTIGTAPYWRAYGLEVLPYVAEQSGQIAQLAATAGKAGQIWIQSYKIPTGSEEEVALAVKTAFACGIRDIWAWSYFGTSYMSYIACGNPAKVWACLGRIYHHIKEMTCDDRIG